MADPTSPRDELVEAVAVAIAEQVQPWDETPAIVRVGFRAQARAAIDVLIAAGWTKGQP